MANPQLEDGYTQVANEILERLMMTHLSSNQWQVLLCIIRKTYGFKKKADFIANSQIVESTGLCKAVVSRSLKTLTLMNLIEHKGKFTGLQKDWELWQKLAIQSTNKELAEQSILDVKLAEQSTNEKLAIPSTELAISSTKVSSPRITQKKKETYTKETLQKKYGEFQNVLLTDEEFEKLITKFGDETTNKIEVLSSGIESHGYKYKSHYATILNWDRRDKKENGNGQNKRFTSRDLPKQYTKPEDVFTN